MTHVYTLSRSGNIAIHHNQDYHFNGGDKTGTAHSVPNVVSSELVSRYFAHTKTERGTRPGYDKYQSKIKGLDTDSGEDIYSEIVASSPRAELDRSVKAKRYSVN